MFKLVIPPYEMFNEETGEFYSNTEETVLILENSLYAISLWETKYKKQYFPKKKINPYTKEKPNAGIQTNDELIYYIKCMATNKSIDEIDDKVFLGLNDKNIQEIMDFLQDSHSATHLPEQRDDGKKGRNFLTSEVVYAWMSELQIPWEAQYWNINRLFNLIQIINDDNTPPDKKKKQKAYDRMKEWDKINEARKAKLGTKG